MLLQEISDDEKIALLQSSCLKSYVSATTYLQQDLPFNNKVTNYVEYLHPEKRNHSSSKQMYLAKSHKRFLKPLSHLLKLLTW